MLEQFQLLQTERWLNNEHDPLMNMFPLLRAFPNVGDKPGLPYHLLLHDLSHFMQFVRNNEEHRLFLPGFGWGTRAASFNTPRNFSVANREAEVFAIQFILDEMFFRTALNRDNFFNLDTVSGMLGKHFEGSRDGDRKIYWKKVIEDHMEELKPTYNELANKTFQFVVDNKALLQ